jgi:hypothetical protein
MGFSSKEWSAPNETPDFHPCQIVCLEYENNCLYAEVVQVVYGRQICWVRPLILTVGWLKEFISENRIGDEPCWYDLRQGSDLLLPMILFRPALDTEVLPLFNRLYISESESESEHYNIRIPGHQKLQQFIQQIWQARPEVFQ